MFTLVCGRRSTCKWGTGPRASARAGIRESHRQVILRPCADGRLTQTTWSPGLWTLAASADDCLWHATGITKGQCPDMTHCCDTSRKAIGRYDLAVIGAGSAGFSAAITAAEEGANDALIGHGPIGGTCVNVGCVPSTTLIRAVDGLHHNRKS